MVWAHKLYCWFEAIDDSETTEKRRHRGCIYIWQAAAWNCRRLHVYPETCNVMCIVMKVEHYLDEIKSFQPNLMHMHKVKDHKM